MRHVIYRLAALIVYFTLVSGFSTAHAQEVRQQVIRFAAGTSSARLVDRIRGYDSVEYSLKASAGQTLGIELSSRNPQAYFNLWGPRGDEAIYNASIEGNSFAGRLPETGEYRIQVYMMRAAARRNETADYSLDVSITGRAIGTGGPIVIPAPDSGYNESDDAAIWHVRGLRPGDTLNIRSGAGTAFRVIGALEEGTPVRNLGCQERDGGFWCRVSTYDRPRISGWVNGRYISDDGYDPAYREPPPEMDDALVPGTPYHAVGPIRCEFAGDAGVRMCDFGVIRNGPFATIDITFPDGFLRTLEYRAGRFTAKDGSEVRSRKQGDTAIVIVNGTETFYIPDAVVMGG